MSLVCTNHPCHSYNCPQWAWHWCIPIITSLKFHWIPIYSIVHYRIVKTIAGYKKRKLTSSAIQPNIVSSLAVAEGALCPCPLQRPLPFALGSGSAHLPPPLHSERTFCRLADSGGFVMYQLMWTLRVPPHGQTQGILMFINFFCQIPHLHFHMCFTFLYIFLPQEWESLYFKY